MYHELSIEKAQNILNWAEKMHPGAWIDHSRVVARAAKLIAAKCNDMDEERAYSLGLLHDIGRYEGKTSLHHILAGYDLMMKNGYNEAAQICISHSFPIKNLNIYAGSQDDCTDEEKSLITSLIYSSSYTDYDKLIQLCDSISLSEGVCLMEKRLVDIVIRHGIRKYTHELWISIFKLKNYFECKIGNTPFYSLFPEVIEITFGCSINNSSIGY